MDPNSWSKSAWVRCSSISNKNKKANEHDMSIVAKNVMFIVIKITLQWWQTLFSEADNWSLCRWILWRCDWFVTSAMIVSSCFIRNWWQQNMRNMISDWFLIDSPAVVFVPSPRCLAYLILIICWEWFQDALNEAKESLDSSLSSEKVIT